MSDEPKLLPCPFCGSNNIGHEHITTYSTDSSYDVFGCNDCGSRFEDGTPEDWNNRVPAPAVPDDVAGLIAVLRERQYGANVADTLTRWDRAREAAADALEAQAELVGKLRGGRLAMLGHETHQAADTIEAQAAELARIRSLADALVNHPGWGTVNYTDGDMWADADKLRAALTHPTGEPT